MPEQRPPCHPRRAATGQVRDKTDVQDALKNNIYIAMNKRLIIFV